MVKGYMVKLAKGEGAGIKSSENQAQASGVFSQWSHIKHI
jgi:hypothetical protein